MSFDSIEHIAVCPLASKFGDHFLKLPRGVSLRKFLCLENEPPNVIIKRAVHVYVLKQTYDQCRFGRFHNVHLVYRAKFLSLMSKYPRLLTDYRANVTDELVAAVLFP